jgi:hypothetical protein
VRRFQQDDAHICKSPLSVLWLLSAN